MEVGKSPDDLAVAVAASAAQLADCRRVDWVCKHSLAAAALALVVDVADAAARGSSLPSGYVRDVEMLWKKAATFPAAEVTVHGRTAA